MARAAQYSTDQILDAAAQAVGTKWREATIRDVLAASGAPSGSVYHRFPTRHALFGALWERSVRRFHVGLLEASENPDPQEALIALSVHIPRFCREHPLDAKAMSLYRLKDLVDLVPESQRSGLASVNEDVDAALHDVVQHRFGADTPELFSLAMMATRQCPYGMVRPLIGGAIPQEFDAMCAAATRGILGLAEESEAYRER